MFDLGDKFLYDNEEYVITGIDYKSNTEIIFICLSLVDNNYYKFSEQELEKEGKKI